MTKEENYSPPYTITPDIVTLIAKIGESIGRLSTAHLDSELRLRKVNRVKTIQGSLAIEGNTLPQSQIIDIIDGKTVIAPPKEILEVKNTLAVAAFFGWSRTMLVGAVLTLGSLFGGIYAANYSTIHYGPNPSYDSIPINPKTWKEVDLSYFSVINGKRYQNSIDLLRPISWLNTHGMDKVGNTITLSLLKFGINRVKAYVVAIKPTKIDTREINWSKVGSRPVIGTFKRYAPDVRTYTLRDSKGHSDHIHATPNHPFYVQNKHGFVAIEDVKDTDVLVGMESNADLTVDDSKGNARLGDVVHLICGKGQHSHCGKPYSNSKHPMAVYNLEIYRQHVFLVGDDKIIVHNCNMPPDNDVAPPLLPTSYVSRPAASLTYLFKTEQANRILDYLSEYEKITLKLTSQSLNFHIKVNLQELRNEVNLARKVIHVQIVDFTEGIGRDNFYDRLDEAVDKATDTINEFKGDHGSLIRASLYGTRDGKISGKINLHEYMLTLKGAPPQTRPERYLVYN